MLSFRETVLCEYLRLKSNSHSKIQVSNFKILKECRCEKHSKIAISVIMLELETRYLPWCSYFLVVNKAGLMLVLKRLKF